MRDIEEHGLINAISIQGGSRFIRNATLTDSRELSIKVVSDADFRFIGVVEGRVIGAKVESVDYEFALTFKKRGEGFEVTRDNISLTCDLVELEGHRARNVLRERPIGGARIAVRSVDRRVDYEFSLTDEGQSLNLREFYATPPNHKMEPGAILLEAPYLVAPQPPRGGLLGTMAIYDFDPKLTKRAAAITGKWELEEDGSNLPIVLKNILSRPDDKRKFTNLIRDILPFVKELNVERYAGKSLFLKMREIYGQGYIPGSAMSDGTANVAALIVALYFEDKPVVVVEEPERNIHPVLMGKLVSVLRDAAANKQVLVTTHNPEIVRYGSVEDLILISRDKKGRSRIRRAADDVAFAHFLQNDIGVEDLFVTGMLTK